MNEWNNNCNFCFYFLPSICSFLYFFRGFLTFLKCFLLSIVKVFPMFIQFIKNRPANISTLFQLGFCWQRCLCQRWNLQLWITLINILYFNFAVNNVRQCRSNVIFKVEIRSVVSWIINKKLNKPWVKSKIIFDLQKEII